MNITKEKYSSLLLIIILVLLSCKGENNSNNQIGKGSDESKHQTVDSIATVPEKPKGCNLDISLIKSSNLREISLDLLSKTKDYISTEDEMLAREYELFFFKTFKGLGHNVEPYFSKLKASKILEDESLKANPIACKRMINLRLMSVVRSSKGGFPSINSCPIAKPCNSDIYTNIVESLGHVDFNLNCLIGREQELLDFCKKTSTKEFVALIRKKDCNWILNCYLAKLKLHKLNSHRGINLSMIESALYNRLKYN